jgi:hypothetical protein
MPPRISDLRGRLGVAGIDVGVSGGRLMAHVRTPIPGLSRAFELEPDDAHDPDVFRVDLTPLGLPPTRVVFARDAGGRVRAAYADLLLQVFEKRSGRSGPSPWLAGGLGALGAIAVATAVRAARGRARSNKGAAP